MSKFRLGKRSVGLLIIISLLCPKPSYATIGFTLPSFNTIFTNLTTNLTAQYNGILSQITNDLKNFGGLKQYYTQIANMNLGSFNLVDPIASGQALKALLGPHFAGMPQLNQVLSLQRMLTKQVIGARTGTNGQNVSQAAINNATSIAQQATTLATNAQNLTASQDVLKAIAAIQAMQVSLEASSITEKYQSRQESIYNTLMAAQNATLQQANLNKGLITDMGTTSLEQEMSGMSSLNMTSANS